MFYELDRSHGDLPIKSEKLDGMGGQMLLPEYQSSDSNPQLLDPDSSFLTTRPHRQLQSDSSKSHGIVVYAGSMVKAVRHRKNNTQRVHRRSGVDRQRCTINLPSIHADR